MNTAKKAESYRNDRLEHIFFLQESFDSDLAQLRELPQISMEEWVQKEVLAIVAELGELLNEINFKWWKNPRPVNRERVKEELVDLLHFFVSLCLKVDLGAEELYQGYLKKNRENFRRQQGLSSCSDYQARTEE